MLEIYEYKFTGETISNIKYSVDFLKIYIINVYSIFIKL